MVAQGSCNSAHGIVAAATAALSGHLVLACPSDEFGAQRRWWLGSWGRKATSEKERAPAWPAARMRSPGSSSAWGADIVRGMSDLQKEQVGQFEGRVRGDETSCLRTNEERTLRASACLCAHVSVCVCLCMLACVFACVCVYVCVCVCVCVQ